jgi:integrase
VDQLSADHLDWLDRRRTRAPNTIAGRRRVLRSIGNAGTATRDQIEAWWDTRAGLSAGTRAVDLSHVRAFYHWCRLYEHRPDDPSIRIEAPRVGNRIPNRAKPSDLAALADLPADLYRAVLLGAYAGLRISESAALRWDDVDDESCTLTIRASKGDKSRVVDVSPVLIDWLGTPGPGTVLTGTAAPHDPQTLQRRLNRAFKARGLTITTHSLRHRWGVHAYQLSGDILAVGEMMGHSSPASTRIYAAASSEVKKKIAAGVMRG